MPPEPSVSGRAAAPEKTPRTHLQVAALLVLLPMLLLGGCGQKLTTDSEMTTRVGDLKDTAKCRRLGNVEVSVKPELYAVGGDAKIAEALLVKARNIASEVGADTVAASDEVSDGRQNFRLYICNANP